MPGAKNAPRSRSRRSSVAPASAAPTGGGKKTPLTFSEKELKAVLLEEYDWQRAMVRDLLNRLKKRKET